jgi:hypothetical protein
MTDLRPADVATLLLASGELLPRRRARDQQADVAGLELKRRVLDLLVALDPEPGELELALGRIVELIGPPFGPTRAICASVRDDWEAAAMAPELVDWLVAQALRANDTQGEGRHGRRSAR